MPDDTLTAALEEAKRIADGLQFACRIPDKTPNFAGAGGPAAEAYWEYFHPARVASLLAAVRAVLELHRPLDRGLGPRCEGCATHVTFTPWPCKTYEATFRAFGFGVHQQQEEGTDGGHQ